MQVAIACRHGHLNAETQEYVSQKAGRLTTYFARVTSIQVTVEFVDHRTRVEILVDAEHYHDLVAHDEGLPGEDVRVTFDKTLHKMEQQIRKYKEKVQDHRRDKPLNELTQEADEQPPRQG